LPGTIRLGGGKFHTLAGSHRRKQFLCAKQHHRWRSSYWFWN